MQSPPHPTVPGPEVQLLDKEVPHHALHLAETRGEGCGLVSEGFNEARLVLLPEQTQNEGLLTGLDDLMSAIHQDPYRERYARGEQKIKTKVEKQPMRELAIVLLH